MNDLNAKYQRLPSKNMSRPVHLWTYGWFGQPIIVFPSAAGMAHEWQHAGTIELLSPWIRAGKIKLYCPESNVSVAWTGDGEAHIRMREHLKYRDFMEKEFISFVRDDCRTPNIPIWTMGCSFGGFYAANLALRNPEAVEWALCMSGRYDTRAFLDDYDHIEVHHADPLRYVPHLSREQALRIQKNTKLTLVVGQGDFEGRCLPETIRLGAACRRAGLRCEVDVWGAEAAHHWDSWKRQLVTHLGRRL